MKLETYQYVDGKGWNKPFDESLDSAQTLLLFFSSPDRSIVEPALLKVAQSFPKSLMVGCSSSGEIYDNDVFDNSISLALIQFEETQLSLACEIISETNDSLSIGSRLAKSLLDGNQQHDELRSVLILSDGLAVNGTKLIDSLSSALPSDIAITGGLAGDGDRFEITWVWSDGAFQDGLICAIGFSGENFGVSHGSQGGWDVLGPEREVTRSIDNVLYELDGQPALQLYKKYLGDRAEGLPATGLLFPLAITNKNTSDSDTVRTILAVNEDENSITFAGDIPQGGFVKLMRANFDRLIDGAADAAADVMRNDNLNNYIDGPLLCISISCVGRRLVLGPRTEEEIEAVKNSVPKVAKQIGFYSYGEISPLANGRCDLHNQTMTLTLIWENLTIS